MNLYNTISGMQRVLVVSLVNNHLGFGVVPNEIVFAHKLAVFALPERSQFAMLQSHIHYHWAWQYSSTMRKDINYSPSDCFDTFPLPEQTRLLDDIGERYWAHRQTIVLHRKEGLTSTYNRFHNPAEDSPDIFMLRELHREMDRAVATAYGWTDILLDHDFHQTRQGIRFTISEAARRDVLGRLLRLNHKRYAEEVAQGLHDKRANKKSKRRASTKSSDERSFDFEEQEA
jgi:hypothetical protein